MYYSRPRYGRYSKTDVVCYANKSRDVIKVDCIFTLSYLESTSPRST